MFLKVVPGCCVPEPLLFEKEGAIFVKFCLTFSVCLRKIAFRLVSSRKTQAARVLFARPVFVCPFNRSGSVAVPVSSVCHTGNRSVSKYVFEK